VRKLDRREVIKGSLAAGALIAGRQSLSAERPSTPSGARASNVDVIAYHDLERRPGFKMTILERDGHWYLYTGCFWHRGWNVLDRKDSRMRHGDSIRRMTTARSSCGYVTSFSAAS
jgi:hypothetical protein